MTSDRESWPPIDGIGWRERLLAASSEKAILLICRQYFARWPDVRLGLLPEECRSPQLEHVEDVAEYALRLVRAQHREQRASNELLMMATFFASASTRLSQVASPAPRESPFSGRQERKE